MTKIIIKNQKTGSFEVIERSIPYPAYNIGQKIGYKDDKGVMLYGVITGMDISSHLTANNSDFIFVILLTLDNGAAQIYEDQVEVYYEGNYISLPNVS